MKIDTKHGTFEDNTIVFYDSGLRWLHLTKEDDEISAELHDGRFTTSGYKIIEECRPVTKFVFQVASNLENYTLDMSKNRVLNPETSRKFHSMVLDFVDKHSEWTPEAREEFNNIYAYKDRLIALKERNEQEQREMV